MADASTVELLDFFSMEKDPNNNSYNNNNNNTSVHPPIGRRSSFMGIQNVISKISPQLLKSVIASSSSVPCTPHVVDWDSPLPVPSRARDRETLPLTIFYNGSVMAFDLPPHKAEGILKLAGDSVLKKDPEITMAVSAGDHHDLLGTLTRDLPMSRRKSLQRFLEKRKERLTSCAPYYYFK